MKNLFKVIGIICGLLVLFMLILPENPIRWAYERHLLLSDNILTKLQIQDNCRYHEGAIFAGDGSAHGPSFSCLTKKYFNWDEEKMEIDKMRNILEENGWRYSAVDTFNDRNVSYDKGKLKIRIQPYWIPDQTGKNHQLIVEYSPL